MSSAQKNSSIGKGALAGAIGGFVGALAMSQFAGLWNSAVLREKPRPFLVKGNKVRMSASPQEWDSTTWAANFVANRVLHRKLSRQQQALGATAVHFLVGAALGAVYGAASEVYPVVRAGSGLPFGIAFWLSAVELAMPRMGVTKPSAQYSAAMHADSAGEHAVYGLTTELVRRTVRSRI